MQIRAYGREYLDDAQSHLGEAFDFAIMTLGYAANDFSVFFVNSNVSKQFERGNVKYIAGMNGCELARLILEEAGIPNDAPDALYLDKSPAYWCGWALAFYQWYTSRTFSEILAFVTIEELLRMYHTYHEMDIMQFSDAMNEKISLRKTATNLKKYRTNMGYSQADLSRVSGVPLRQIQLLEQRQRSINKTASETLFRLSRALYCNMEDLIER